MIGFDEAIALTLDLARPLGTERIPIAEATGRTLAAPLFARSDAPFAAVSAMDGYAVRDADLANPPARLPVAGEAFAGGGGGQTLPPGACVRIFTGAPVPDGADRVVIQENVTRDGDVAVFETPPGAGRHIRAAGSDFRAGDELLPSGRTLDARAIVAAASADRAEIEVWRRPKLVVLATGDELAEPGQAHERPGAIPESVSFGVAALAEAWGAILVGRNRLRDDPAGLEAAATQALDIADIVAVTGGASVGEKDFARAMFGPSGLDLVFSKVAIKPGKPVWIGRAGGKLIVGLPGNPTSALVTARLFLAPLVAGLAGRDPAESLRWRSLPLAAAIPACGDRETFLRARRADNGVESLTHQDSSAQRVLAGADLLVRQRAGSPARNPGETVDTLAF